MSQIKTKFIQDNAVTSTKVRLTNDAYLRSRNAADNGDVNMMKVNGSDRIEFASLPQVTADPSVANDLVRKAYVDAIAQGIKPKQAARVASTANIVLTTGTLLTIDGVTVSAGDRVLVKDQTDSEENGVYIAAVGAWSRATDFDELAPIDEINGATVSVQEGTVSAGIIYVQYGTVTTLDTDAILFTYFNSLQNQVGGDGIDITGATISVDHDGEGLTFATDQLALELDGSTLSKSATGLKVAALGVTSAELAADSVITSKILNANVTTAKIANDAVDKDKIAADVAGLGLGQNIDGSLEVNVDDASIEIATDTLQVKDLGITTAKINTAAVTEAKLDSGIDAQTFDATHTAANYTPAAVGGEATTKISAHLKGIDSALAAITVPTSNKQTVTLIAGDITNGFYDLAQVIKAGSLILTPQGGPVQIETLDYSVSLTGGAGGNTRITWSTLGLDGILEAGDVVVFQYTY